MNQPQLSVHAESSQSSFQSLPEPEAEAQGHSRRLCQYIMKTIRDSGGFIDFARYMEQVLYAPGLGYYSAGAAKLGPAGDFITAPEISSLYGRCLAHQCREILVAVGNTGEILELGAGSGKLAVDILSELERLDSLPQRYLILEVSADLRARQHETIERHLPHLLDRVVWLERLPPEPVDGVVIANEVLDALPVHCVRLDADGLDELVVAADGEQFSWQRRPLHGDALHAFKAVLAELPESLPRPYVTEINTGLKDWLAAVAGVLHQGVMLFVDYGYPRAEYYHPQRSSGTLICHYRHRAHDNPFLYPGLQDISASVDFTLLAEAALDCGLQVAGFTSQAHFLLGCGLDALLAEASTGDQKEYMALSREVKQLTLPSEMGERFKVMALTRNYSLPLTALQYADFRHRL